MSLGDDVLVLNRNNRNIEPEHLTGLAHKVARRRDQMLTGDVALVGLHQPLVIFLLLDRDHPCVTVDLGTVRTRTCRHCLGQISRLHVTIVRMLDCAE